MADLKQQLAWLNKGDALTMSERQLEQRIETTIAHTFAWMWWVMFVSFALAYVLSLWIIDVPFSAPLYRWSWIAGLWIIFWMNRSWRKLSYWALAWLLLLFWLLEGYGLSGIFRAYDLGSIYNVFMSSTILFAILAVVWYNVSINIARTWPILFWSMIALIISLLLNAFVFQSGMADMMLSVAGVVIFSWFVIYDMNILRKQAMWTDSRIEILMALWLFINFVNIFLFLLRLFGGQD